MANEIDTGWPVEAIPDEHHLFLRVHEVDVDPDGEPYPRAFRNQPKGSTGMSTDWERYAAASDTRLRGRKPPEEYAVVKFTAGEVRSLPGQIVVHRPDHSNRAHSEVVGDKTTEVRERFMQLYQTEIALNITP